MHLILVGRHKRVVLQPAPNAHTQTHTHTMFKIVTCASCQHFLSLWCIYLVSFSTTDHIVYRQMSEMTKWIPSDWCKPSQVVWSTSACTSGAYAYCAILIMAHGWMLSVDRCLATNCGTCINFHDNLSRIFWNRPTLIFMFLHCGLKLPIWGQMFTLFG